MIINIDPDKLKDCREFAKKRIKSSKGLYAYRGESKSDKMIQDIVIGTIGEWAIKEYFDLHGMDCTVPDMTIYEKNNKSYNADLLINYYDVHVKSQGIKSAKLYGNSYLVQRSDKVVKEPSDKDLFAFAEVDLDNNEVRILGFCPAKRMIYGECKVPRYRHTKKAIYIKDLKDRVFLF